MKGLNLLLVFLLVSLFAFSQSYQRKTAEEKARKYTSEMAAEIILSQEQEEKIYQINLDVSKRFDSLYASKPEKDLQRKVTIDILRARDKNFRTVLTNEQFLRYDDIQREKREKKMKERQEKEALLKDEKKS